MKSSRLLLFILLLCSSTVSWGATHVPSPVTYYINATTGSDKSDGLSPQTPWKLIQTAADRVNPGDTVILAAGVYYEDVAIRRFGTKDHPITFKADKLEKDRVVITGANRAIREHKIKWVLEDKAVGLYSIPLDEGGMPARVLYSGADLYPYRNVDLLKKFHVSVALSKSQSIEVPGPTHGYTWSAETKRLYVRLHADGRYGSTNPNDHLMSVAPVPDGVSYAMTKPTPEGRSNIRIIADGWPAYVVLDGFTFETPSLTAVYTSGSDVTVQNCRFLGCRLGVSGIGGDLKYYRGYANRVTVRQCEYTQWPTYEDSVELLANPENVQKRFWYRKHVNDGLPGKRFIYETGMIGWAGKDWDVYNNQITDVFEAFSAKSTTVSENLHIHDNVIEKVLDNAVELENNSQQLHFYRNVVRDVFNPVSWQPNGSKPIAGAAYIYQNVIYNTPEHLKAFGFRHASVFKIMGPSFAPLAPPGLLVFNNTVYWPDAELMGASAIGNRPDRISFYNNIFAVDFCFKMNSSTEWEPSDGFEMVNNLTGAIDPRVFAHRFMAGKGGIALDNFLQIGFTNPAKFDFSATAGSPGVGKAIPVPGTELKLKDIGAVQQGDHWYPPVVGPAYTPSGAR